MFKVLRRLSSKTRYLAFGLLLIAAGIALIVSSFFLKGSDGHVATVFASVGAGLIPTGAVVFLEPWLVSNITTSAQRIARASAERVVEEASSVLPTAVTVSWGGEPIVGASVLAFAPNKTWKQAPTARDGNAYLDLHATEQTMTVFVAADQHEAHVERGWVPASEELALELAELPEGGSRVFASGTGYVPGLSGRLNPILDDHDRTYIYADNIAVNGEVSSSPHDFTPGVAMLMEDANGNSFQVCVVDIIGQTSLIEYRRQ